MYLIKWLIAKCIDLFLADLKSSISNCSTGGTGTSTIIVIWPIFSLFHAIESLPPPPTSLLPESQRMSSRLIYMYSLQKRVQCARYRVQCAGCIVQCAVCSVQCAVCSVQCAGCRVQCAVCKVQGTVCGVHCALCSVQCAVCRVQGAGCKVQYTVYSVQRTLHEFVHCRWFGVQLLGKLLIVMIIFLTYWGDLSGMGIVQSPDAFMCILEA